jgi:hypothetical protein
MIETAALLLACGAMNAGTTAATPGRDSNTPASPWRVAVGGAPSRCGFRHVDAERLGPET